MMVRGMFSQLMASGLHDIFVHFLKLQMRDEEFPYIFNRETSDKAFEDVAEFGGLGPMVIKEEGESVIYRDIAPGGMKRYIHTVWALGVRTSWELYKDDQYRLINQVPKALSKSAFFVREQQAWNNFNLGFTTVTTTDGVSLFNNQHPLLGGTSATAIGPGVANVISAAGTYPNRPATDVDLSITALQLAVQQFERMIDSSGIPVQVRPHLLVVPPELKWAAREILGSPHKPYVATNEINSMIKEDFQYFIGHYLTSATAWFMVGEKQDHTLKFIDREPLDEDFSDDFDTRSIKQIAFQRFSTGADNWIGTWGSNGP